jgi:hypothetical protein
MAKGNRQGVGCLLCLRKCFIAAAMVSFVLPQNTVIEIRQYVDRQRRNSFERWFNQLDATARARIAVALERMQRGNFASIKGGRWSF